jgi:hypothetical protein
MALESMYGATAGVIPSIGFSDVPSILANCGV